MIETMTSAQQQTKDFELHVLKISQFLEIFSISCPPSNTVRDWFRQAHKS